MVKHNGPIKASLAKPCAMCPFSKIVDFRLRPGRREEIAQSLLHGDAPFPCHKTIHYGDEEQDDARFCAGAIVWLNKVGALGNSLYIRLLWLAQEDAEDDEVFFNFDLLRDDFPHIYDTVEAFLAAPSSAHRDA